jgi:hypothetical protein
MRVTACTFEGAVSLSMYSGSCSSLNCIGAGSDNTRCRGYGGSSVGFDSVAGEVYYLLVQSYYGEESSFELSIEEAFPPENDECSAAMGPIEPGSGAIFGSNMDAIFDGVFSCYAGSTSGGLWYVDECVVVTVSSFLLSLTCNLEKVFCDRYRTSHAGRYLFQQHEAF